jgi:glycosidase
VAEQAVWFSYGNEYFNKGNVDRVFAFQLQAAITSFDKNKIAAIADTTLNMIPPGKQQVVFIENHDMDRFASKVNGNLDEEKVGAALNLLIGGVPAIYYGQELGMVGKNANGKYGMTDANDIPRREAFEWYKADDGKGMALWYKNGPWWDNTNLKPNDGISLEEERSDPNSLFNFYKKMISLHQSYSELINGRYQTLSNNNDKVFSFSRNENTSIVVVINLSGQSQQTTVHIQGVKDRKLKQLWGSEKVDISVDQLTVNLPAYGIDVWQVQ